MLEVIDEGGNQLNHLTHNVVWNLPDSAAGLFQIDQRDGAISLSSPATLDYETNSEHMVMVSVTATVKDVTVSAQESITIVVTNVLEEIRIEATASGVITEGLVGVVDGISLIARDENNIELTTGLTWKITRNSSNSAFEIDNAGVVSTVIPLSFSAGAPPYSIVVQAQDISDMVRSELITIMISVIEVPIRIEVVAVDDGGNDFWVIIDFGGQIEVDVAQLENISISQFTRSDGTITGVSIVGSPAVGFPSGLMSDLIPAQSIHFRIRPSGILDDGESAEGREQIIVSLPANLLSSSGLNVINPQRVTINPPDNGNPEITGFIANSHTVEPLVDGRIAVTLSYRLLLTETIDQATLDMLTSNSVVVAYDISKEALDAMLSPGISDQPLGGVINAIQSTQVGVLMDNRSVRIESRVIFAVDMFSQIQSYAMSVDLPSPIEDCQSTQWYSEGIRTQQRATPCYSQDAIANPFEYFNLFNRNEAVEMVFNQAITLSPEAQSANSNALGFVSSFGLDRTSPLLSSDGLTLTLTATTDVSDGGRYLTQPVRISFEENILSNGEAYNPNPQVILPPSLNLEPRVTEVVFESGTADNNVAITFSASDGSEFTLTNTASTLNIIHRVIFKDKSGEMVAQIDGASLIFIESPSPELSPDVTASQYVIRYGFSEGFPSVENSGDLTATFIFDDLIGSNAASGMDSSKIRPRQLSATDVSLPDNVDPKVTYDFQLAVADDQSSLADGQVRYELESVLTFNEEMMGIGESDFYRLRTLNRNSFTEVLIASGELTIDSDSAISNSRALIAKQIVWDRSVVGYRLVIDTVIASASNGSLGEARGVVDRAGNSLVGAVYQDADDASVTDTPSVYSPLFRIAEDGSATENTISESAAINTPVSGIMLQLLDDTGSALSNVQWSLSESISGLFTISNDGVITLSRSNALDYESSVQSYNLISKAEVNVADEYSYSVEIIVPVAVVNVFERITIQDSDANPNVISELSLPDTPISGLTLSAIDEGDNLLDNVSWSIQQSAENLFTIDSDSGVIARSSNGALDFESVQNYIVTVTAESAKAGTTLSVESQVTIAVGNALEEITLSDALVVSNTVAETAVVGTPIMGVRLEVRDEANRLLSNGLVWEILESTTNAFAVDETNGELSVAIAAILDYEGTQQHHLTVQVMATMAGVTKTTQIPVVVNVTNVLENITASDTDSSPNMISETAPAGTPVAGLSLEVRDEGNRIVPSVMVAWSLTQSASGVFEINENTGAISLSLNQELDFEILSSYDLNAEVQAISDGVTVMTEITVAVIVTNVLESVIISDNNDTSNAILASASIDTEVSGIELQAVDENGGHLTHQLNNLMWSFAPNGNISNRFAINTMTGQLRWASPNTVLSQLPMDTRTFTVSIIATAPNDLGVMIQSEPLVIQIGTIEDARLRLRLFLEGPLQ